MQNMGGRQMLMAMRAGILVEESVARFYVYFIPSRQVRLCVTGVIEGSKNAAWL